jgi:hypothetical protein
MTNWRSVPIGDIKPNPNNPRIIKDDKFKKLVQSIKDFPEMLKLRPIVVNAEMVVLGGNMRLKACQAAGIKDVPVIFASDLSEAKQREFIIKDNVGFGEWEWETLANEWDTKELTKWGLDIPEENPYTKKVEAPIYEPSGSKPELTETFDLSKYEQLLRGINASGLTDPEKDVLRHAATRHIVFDYAKMADVYAHSSPEMQRLMEENALVIIDFDKAIELGYIHISEEVLAQFDEEFTDE